MFDAYRGVCVYCSETAALSWYWNRGDGDRQKNMATCFKAQNIVFGTALHPPRLQDFRGYKCVFALPCVLKIWLFLCERVCGRNTFWHLCNYANMNSVFALTENKPFFFLINVYVQYLHQLHFRKGKSQKGRQVSLHPEWTLLVVCI